MIERAKFLTVARTVVVVVVTRAEPAYGTLTYTALVVAAEQERNEGHDQEKEQNVEVDGKGYADRERQSYDGYRRQGSGAEPETHSKLRPLAHRTQKPDAAS